MSIRFITFEGPDASGKTTQIELLCNKLKEAGKDFITTREPGGTRIGESLRDIILDPKYQEMSALTEMLLYAAARAQHVDELIKPALDKGMYVISDRFTDSSLAYQGYARGLGDTVSKINDIATMGLIPDISFFLLTDPSTAQTRMQSRKADRIEAEGIAYQRMVYDAYNHIADTYPKRVRRIDAGQSIEKVHMDIMEALDLT